MTTSNNLEFKKDSSGKKVTVVRYFDAPVDHVWQAWTESELLDQWWAPKPWKTETNSMQFREGGSWQYAMVGPENERHLCRVDYKTIQPHKSFSGDDYFCDENWNRNKDMPLMHWKCDFSAEGNGTKVTVTITVDNEEDLRRIVEMGFEQGFTSALENLDSLLLETANKGN